MVRRSTIVILASSNYSLSASYCNPNNSIVYYKDNEEDNENTFFA